ncbi:MAG: 4Fe-4S binding protein [Clostridia bacterium]|nr:4Fe-4S binding protein [Clostridia bacterium]
MNAVIYFSCTGHSKAVAEVLAARLEFELTELNAQTQDKVIDGNYSAAVVVFPVHCQSYPVFMKRFFRQLKAERVALIATYGKADAGNAVFEAAKSISADIVAAAYIPVGHSYLNDGYTPSELPQALIEKIGTHSTVTVTKRKKTPFAGFLPSARSRILVKIKRNEKCVDCNICGSVCPMGAIEKGKTNAKCVRCLKCVASCPHGALEIKKARILARYLEKADCKETILFI